MEPWIEKAWYDILTKLKTMCHQVERSVRMARMTKYMEVRSPTLISHVTALTNVEDLGGVVPSTPCTYPVSRPKATKFPQRPEECEHEPEHTYRHGNPTGSYLECRACGAGWQAMDWINPVTQEEIKVFIIPLPPRPRPGAQRPKPSPTGSMRLT